jgi:DNA-binding NtrC family response regulator
MSRTDILLVDDDVHLARAMAELLRRHGYGVTLVHRGRDAMTLLEREQVSLVISDLFMPDGDGIELLNHLRGLTPTTPVLAISGGDNTRVTGMLQVAAKLGAIRTLAKPFEAATLIGLVRELIGPPAGASAA